MSDPVYIALGSNLDDPVNQIHRALESLRDLPCTHLINHSRLYRSAPVGHLDQPEFINAVAYLETSLDPSTLLHQLLNLEHHHGRQRLFPNGPRTLDLDILVHGTKQVHLDHLTIPHPRLAERLFVLLPWLDIAPGNLVIPGLGSLSDLVALCPPNDITPLHEKD
ncbi:MAG: 2-amino-4-hydroxy-6-hydroxymethyldihydropteridine diphosphokinase [Betaproteobacteria bacterium]|jgi:2-amino-4-hydroxy-6-hydroxymethyldihydropteridine pyrophosphokinase|nr:2-amino-4-hydroxy-6-hydroxymethyldihydropteridine diphosphokinase [Betaproteobacteria bacterium]